MPRREPELAEATLFVSLLLLVCPAATAQQPQVAQSKDWLMASTPKAMYTSRATVTTTTADDSNGARIVTLSNGLIERVFMSTKDGGLCTVELRNLVSSQTFFRAMSPEANVTLNGSRFAAREHAKRTKCWYFRAYG